MNIRQAIDDTMALAQNGGDTSEFYKGGIESLSFKHICEMHKRIKEDQTMSDTKLYRWLGWMQAAVVSWGLWTLEDMKKINMRNT